MPQPIYDRQAFGGPSGADIVEGLFRPGEEALRGAAGAMTSIGQSMGENARERRNREAMLEAARIKAAPKPKDQLRMQEKAQFALWLDQQDEGTMSGKPKSFLMRKAMTDLPGNSYAMEQLGKLSGEATQPAEYEEAFLADVQATDPTELEGAFQSDIYKKFGAKHGRAKGLEAYAKGFPKAPETADTDAELKTEILKARLRNLNARTKKVLTDASKKGRREVDVPVALEGAQALLQEIRSVKKAWPEHKKMAGDLGDKVNPDYQALLKAEDQVTRQIIKLSTGVGAPKVGDPRENLLYPQPEQ